MTSNQAMLKGVNPSYGMIAPVLVDWLPWSHTFGGNNNFNLVLSNGGSSTSTRAGRCRTRSRRRCATSREVSPTVYYNVPKGFEVLLPYLQADEACASACSPICSPSSTPGAALNAPCA